MIDQRDRLILVTGGSGYVGGRLLRTLAARGHRLRCLVRQSGAAVRAIAPAAEVVRGDVLEATSLTAALEGVDTAHYLIHALGTKREFGSLEAAGARNFAAAAQRTGVRRIVYLGGLGSGPRLSDHLRSRQEVGRILRASGVPTIELRASIIIGSGSASFEMIRALVQRLPVMITPRWVHTATQPIAIEDVLAYLLAAQDLAAAESRVFEIGGADQVTYLDLMRECARQMGLRRAFISVPVLTPRLSSLWLGLVTPVHARIGRKLVDGLVNPTVVTDASALREFPGQPLGVRESVARALLNEDREFAETRWSDALSANPPVKSWGGTALGGRIVDSRVIHVPVPAAQAFTPIERIGGERGWHCANWLWRVRGFLDLLVGGVGMRRGRRDPRHLRVDDTLDFWRVEAIEPGRLLRLRAEMKVPGRAWLQFEVEERAGGSAIRQTAVFDPRGVFGLVYWYALYPLHAVIFRGMLRNLGRAALSAAPE